MPVYCRPRPLPYAFRGKVEQEINRLVQEGVITPIDSSEWATPIVPVLKTDGSIRICGDYKVTLNQHLEIDRHPLPRVENIFVGLSGGKIFSKIDLSHAYQQLELAEESKRLTTITTHKGLYVYNRLPYGIASCPGLFQREMDRLFQSMEGVECFLDDIIVTGSTREEHMERLHRVLSTLEEKGLTVKLAKCEFFKDSICVLGHKIDAHGLHMSPDKVEAILQAPAPKDMTQLRALIGLISYYSKFVPNLASLLYPWYRLLQKDAEWVWSKECEQTMTEVKRVITSDRVLMNYDPGLELRLACDASSYGLGAVLSHVLPDGTVRPVAYASRTLSKSERGYAQIQKEALAIVFGVTKFHSYVYGRPFTLLTDHRPLTTLFGSKKGIPQMAANRLQRWALFLSGYTYDIKYVRSEENQVADGLSRIPLEASVVHEPVCTYLNIIEDELPFLCNQEVQQETAKDELLSCVLRYVNREKWPENVDEDLRPYYNRREELYADDNCLMWGHRVIIPNSIRPQVLQELHGSHLGIVKMKGIARSYFWWPKLDSEIEQITNKCSACLSVRDQPAKAALHVWPLPTGPGVRLHADFAGPFLDRMYLLVVDAYSKWLEVVPMKNITTSRTIAELRKIFARWGLPIQINTDNGSTFCSAEFTDFLRANGIKHHRSPPYHPATNGAAENSVRTFKKKIKASLFAFLEKAVLSEVQIDKALCNFLLDYHNAPHCTTGLSPAELHLGRKISTRFDRLLPTLADRVQLQQRKQIENFRGKRCVEFKVGEMVQVKDYRKNKNWLRAKIIKRLSPVTYVVEPYPGQRWKRHVDQIMGRVYVEVPCTERAPVDIQDLQKLPPVVDDLPQSTIVQDGTVIKEPVMSGAEVETKLDHEKSGDTTQPEIRRSGRIRKAPSRLGY